MRFVGKATRAQLHRLLDDVIDRNNQGYETFFGIRAHVNAVDLDLYNGAYNKEEIPQNFNVAISTTSIDGLCDTIEEMIEEDTEDGVE